MALAYDDTLDLRFAKMLLEQPSFAARMTSVFGKPIEKGLDLLPDAISGRVQKVTEKTLTKAISVAVKTMNPKRPRPSRDNLHKLAVSATGYAGGFFGLPALAVEMPVSTTLILRSVADIARSEGEDLSRIESRLACVEVFALGSRNPTDDSAETGYFTIRAALSATVTEAAAYIAENGLLETGAPVLVRLVSQIASRFGPVVSEKIASSAVPVIGAAGGAFINTIFMDHFQDIARGHFIVRRLERHYGKEDVKEMYQTIRLNSDHWR